METGRPSVRTFNNNWWGSVLLTLLIGGGGGCCCLGSRTPRKPHQRTREPGSPY